MTVLQTIGVFVLIPLALYGVLALFTLWPKIARGPRYRPGQAWNHEPVWWIGNPQGVGQTTAGQITAGHPHGAGTASAATTDSGLTHSSNMAATTAVTTAAAAGTASPTARGGARGSW